MMFVRGVNNNGGAEVIGRQAGGLISDSIGERCRGIKMIVVAPDMDINGTRTGQRFLIYGRTDAASSLHASSNKH